MRAFEYVRTDDYARPAVVANYKRSLAVHGDTLEAAQTLPAFRKKNRTWKQSRPFYHIDRTSRAAALNLNLCLRVLQQCTNAIARPGQHATRCSTDESGSLQREQP